MSLLFLGLTGCNHIGLAFKWVDTYVASKVDDYFDINSKQSRDLKKGIQKDLQQVKTDVLPQWIARFKELEHEVIAGTLDKQKTAFYFNLFLNDVEHINSRFSDTARDFIENTRPEQLAYFARAYQKKTREDLVKYQAKEKYRKEMRSKYFEYTEMFLGPLTEQQKKMIEAHLDTAPFPGELKARNKEYILARYLEARHTPKAQKEFLNSYYRDPRSLSLPEYQTAYTNYYRELQNLTTGLVDSLTTKQKRTLLENLREKTLQLEKIAGT